VGCGDLQTELCDVAGHGERREAMNETYTNKRQQWIDEAQSHVELLSWRDFGRIGFLLVLMNLCLWFIIR
jgi:hypothetical protein